MKEHTYLFLDLFLLLLLDLNDLKLWQPNLLQNILTKAYPFWKAMESTCHEQQNCSQSEYL